ncbi:MAG: hypothetical protein KBE09_04295 [Candidatus Pacebacteria bacterium]|nr:hypothetical protein [Candidatus Paceibacterota bacterium]
MSEKQYFVPAPLMARVQKHLMEGMRKRKAQYMYDGFRVQGVLLSAPATLMRQFLKRMQLSVGYLGDVNDHSVAVLSHGGSTTLRISEGHVFGQHQSDARHVEDVCNLLSSISGLEVCVHFDVEDAVTPVMLPRKRGAVYPEACIHIIVGSSPMGDSVNYESDRACGVSFYPDGATALFPGATKGRGYRVLDADEKCIGQIVGDSIFLFAPVANKETIKTLTTHGDLFKKMLCRAWNAQLGPRDAGVRSMPITSRQHYTTVLGTMDNLLPTVLAKRIADNDRYLKNLRRQYTRIVAERQQFLLMQKTFEENSCFGKPQERNTAWRVLKGIPEFKTYTWREEGLQILTNHIVQEYEGVRYLLGVYGARIELAGRVSLWCEHSFHPKGAGHPHISKQGVTCFGNIEFALGDAAAEGRFSDVALLLAQWFRSGYEPHLADFKIEEWPIQGRNT